MEIISKWKEKDESFWEVEIEENRYVTIKQSNVFDSYMYIMENEDGTKIYDEAGFTYDDMDDTLEEEIIDFVYRDKENNY